MKIDQIERIIISLIEDRAYLIQVESKDGEDKLFSKANPLQVTKFLRDFLNEADPRPKRKSSPRKKKGGHSNEQ